jgi:hypothetical protein
MTAEAVHGQEELRKKITQEFSDNLRRIAKIRKNNITPLKQELVCIICKNRERTSESKQLFTIKKINLLTLFKGVIAIYGENHAQP